MRRLLTVLGIWSLTILPAWAGTFTNFESGHVRPLAVAPNSDWLFAVNTPDNRLTIFALTPAGATFAAEVPVGLEPVAVATRVNGVGRTEAWVVNHLSDSVSIVEIDPFDVTHSHVTRTLLVGDEPRDILFAGSAGNRAFVTAAHRGQNRPGDPQLTTEGVGRADLWAFDANNPGAALGGTPLAIVQLFGDTPRALAKSPDGSTVYVGVFHSGNRSTTLVEPVVTANGGLPPPPPGSTPGAPPTALIVKFNGSQWVDEINRNWSPSVPFSLPDRDVFLIDADASPPALLPSNNSVSGVGTILFNMAVSPLNGKLFVSNTDARNQVRFEPVIRGHIAESRITVISGTTPTPVHLNPHINFNVTPGPASEIAQSIAFPTDMTFSADGQTLYVAALGSGAVAALDASSLEVGVVVKSLIPVGDGPDGLALDAVGNRLFVMNRISHSISVVTNLNDVRKRAETARLPLRYDPSPAPAKVGRRFLYDAKLTSGHGDSACASCHIFGDFDSLSWDLGDPFGTVVANPNPFANGGTGAPFHPMKGPMNTQSLRGMAGAGPMHWRGDRTGGADPGGDPLDEDAAFKKFNPAFVGLLGRGAQLTDAQLQAFTDFILTVKYPPNPIHALDNSSTAAETAGRTFFLNTTVDGGNTCVFCHALPFGTGGLSSFEGQPQEMKVPHLRNAYQKIGMFGLSPGVFPGAAGGIIVGDQVRGFGFLHDGGIATPFLFLNGPVFNFGTTPNQKRRNLEQFIFGLDTGEAPIVGQQATITPATFADAALNARINLILARADAGECDVVAKGDVGGEARGALYTGAGSFIGDRAADGTISTVTLLARATVVGQELTITAVPRGNGIRIGVDRDLDGVRDRDELDAGTSPTDATSVPGGAAFTLVRTSTLQLKDKTTPPDPSKRKFTFKSKTKTDAIGNRIVVPAPGGAGDPSLHGATLVIYNSGGTGETVTIPLANGNWTVSNGASPSYTYKDSNAANPISKITLKVDSLSVKGGKSGLAYTLDEAAQGRVAVRLVLGTATVLCADAPPKTSGSPPSTAKFDKVDYFKAASNTPPPALCPQLPIFGSASGAFLDELR